MRSSVEVGATSWILRGAGGRAPAGRSATISPVAPAARASCSNTSQPYVSSKEAVRPSAPEWGADARTRLRDGEALPPRGGAHAGGEGTLSAASRITRAVREPVRAGKAHLDEIGPTRHGGLRERRRVAAGHQVDRE